MLPKECVDVYILITMSTSLCQPFHLMELYLFDVCVCYTYISCQSLAYYQLMSLVYQSKVDYQELRNHKQV